MTLANTTRKTIVATNVKEIRGIFSRLFGMLLSRNASGLVFNSRFGIHTLLMNGPIDILVLDKDRRVVRIRENLVPNRIFVWNPKYNLILELPTGSVRESKTKTGDKLEFGERG